MSAGRQALEGGPVVSCVGRLGTADKARVDEGQPCPAYPIGARQREAYVGKDADIACQDGRWVAGDVNTYR